MQTITVNGKEFNPWTLDCMKAEHAKRSASKCYPVAECKMEADRPPVVWGNLHSPLMFVGLNPYHNPDGRARVEDAPVRSREPLFFNLHQNILNRLSERWADDLQGHEWLRRKRDTIEAELVVCGTPGESLVTEEVQDICGERFLVPAMEAIQPKVIVGLGRSVVGWFCRRYGLEAFEDQISREVGKHRSFAIGDRPVTLIACTHPNWRRYKPLSKVVDVIAATCSPDHFLAARENPQYFYSY